MFPLYFLAPLKNKLTQSLILEFYSPWIRGIQDFPCSQMDLAYSCDSPVAHVWAFWNVGASWIHSAPGAFAGQGLALPLLWQESEGRRAEILIPWLQHGIPASQHPLGDPSGWPGSGTSSWPVQLLSPGKGDHMGPAPLAVRLLLWARTEDF